MSFRLQTLKKRAEFVRARNGRYFAAHGLVLQAVRLSSASPEKSPASYADEGQRPARFGFTATKKLGNAVIRNKIKRRLREAVRAIAPQMARPGYEYVLIGRKSTLKRPFSSLLQDLTIAFDRVHGKRVYGKGGNNRRKPDRKKLAGRKAER